MFVHLRRFEWYVFKMLITQFPAASVEKLSGLNSVMIQFKESFHNGEFQYGSIPPNCQSFYNFLVQVNNHRSHDSKFPIGTAVSRVESVSSARLLF